MLGMPIELFPNDRAAEDFETGMRELRDDPFDHVAVHAFVGLLDLVELPFMHPDMDMLTLDNSIERLYNWMKQEWPNLADWLKARLKAQIVTVKLVTHTVVCDSCRQQAADMAMSHISCDGANSKVGGILTGLPCSCPTCLGHTPTRRQTGSMIDGAERPVI